MKTILNNFYNMAVFHAIIFIYLHWLCISITFYTFAISYFLWHTNGISLAKME
jgi:hypothetical protein